MRHEFESCFMYPFPEILNGIPKPLSCERAKHSFVILKNIRILDFVKSLWNVLDVFEKASINSDPKKVRVTFSNILIINVK